MKKEDMSNVTLTPYRDDKTVFVKNELMLELDSGCIKIEHKTINYKKFGRDALENFIVIANEEKSIFQRNSNISLF